LKKKTILVCGATGFIGRNIIEHFANIASFKVIGVYHNRPPFPHEGVTWVQADLTNPAQVSNVLEGVDILIQAAAVTSGVQTIFSQPEIHITDNVVMNSYLFRMACEKRLEHVLFFSCTIMLHSSDLPLSEQDFDANREMHPRYFGGGWNKVYLEKMCEFFSRIGQTKFTAIRHSNVYGAYDKFDIQTAHVLGASITKVMNAEDSITIWGSGEETRDLIYIDDLVSMVAKVLEKQIQKFSIFNCGSGTPTSINELVRLIISISGKSIRVLHDISKPSIATNIFLNCSKAYIELGWTPTVPLTNGLEATIKWWQKNIGKNNSI
jgi:GDP-L-fucose synthase